MGGESPIEQLVSSPAFIITGIIASFVTLASFVWFVIGRLITKPRVRLEFTKEQRESGPVLVCHIYNDPLSQWWFSLLIIKKQHIDEFSALARLLDGKGQPVCPLDVALHDRQGRHGDTFPLPASVYSLYWGLVFFNDIGPFVVNSDRIQTYLAPDTYEIRMLLHADELDVRVIAQKFVVGVDARVFHWVGEPYKLRADK